jgi:hypothetical protein
VKIARPAQRTLENLPTPFVKAQHEADCARKKRPRKGNSDSGGSDIIDLCMSYDISNDDSVHIYECLGVSCIADLIDLEMDDLSMLSLEPEVESILKRLVLDVKEKSVRKKPNPKLSPTSVVNAATEGGKRSKRGSDRIMGQETMGTETESEMTPRRGPLELIESSPDKAGVFAKTDQYSFESHSLYNILMLYCVTEHEILKKQRNQGHGRKSNFQFESPSASTFDP